MREMFKRDKPKYSAFVTKSASASVVGHVRMPTGEMATVMNPKTYSKASSNANRKIREIVRREERERA